MIVVTGLSVKGIGDRLTVTGVFGVDDDNTSTGYKNAGISSVSGDLVQVIFHFLNLKILLRRLSSAALICSAARMDIAANTSTPVNAMTRFIELPRKRRAVAQTRIRRQ